MIASAERFQMREARGWIVEEEGGKNKEGNESGIKRYKSVTTDNRQQGVLQS